jgi:hypothetical protein
MGTDVSIRDPSMLRPHCIALINEAGQVIMHVDAVLTHDVVFRDEYRVDID